MIDFSCCEVEKSLRKYVNDDCAQIKPLVLTDKNSLIFQKDKLYYAIFTNPKELVLFNGLNRLEVLPNVPYIFTQYGTGTFDFMQGYIVDYKGSEVVENKAKTVYVQQSHTFTNILEYENGANPVKLITKYYKDDSLLYVHENTSENNISDSDFMMIYSNTLSFVNNYLTNRVVCELYVNGELFPYISENPFTPTFSNFYSESYNDYTIEITGDYGAFS